MYFYHFFFKIYIFLVSPAIFSLSDDFFVYILVNMLSKEENAFTNIYFLRFLGFLLDSLWYNLSFACELYVFIQQLFRLERVLTSSILKLDLTVFRRTTDDSSNDSSTSAIFIALFLQSLVDHLNKN